MTEPIAYLKGEFVPASECKLPIYDLGIVLGAAVTDFARTFHHKAYRLEDHLTRFYASCRYGRIKPPVSMEQSREISEKLIEHNSKLAGDSELGLIFYMTAGVNWRYAGAAALPSELEPTYVQHTFPLRSELWKDFFLKGVHCVTPGPRHFPPQCLSSKIKHRNRLHFWIADHEVHQLDPKAIGLFLDINGNITETSGTNFVIYRNGAVISPRRPNILWGISLTVLTEILSQMNIPFREEDIQTYDVVNADEAWMPTTPYCLGPVVKINGTPIGTGKPGPVWRKIIDYWSKMVNKDIYQEITATNPATV